MVLHNNKWDRRAKTKYMKKHGVTAAELSKKPKKKPGNAQEEHAEEEHSEPEEVSPDISASVPETVSDPASVSESEDKDAIETNSSPTEQLDLLPEYEDNEEETELIRKHIARFHLKPEEQKSHIQHVDKAVFDQANAGVERSKLNQRVKNIGTKKKHSELDLDSDSDFEEFMDNLEDSPNQLGKHHPWTVLQHPQDDRAKRVRMTEPQTSFIDSLLK